MRAKAWRARLPGAAACLLLLLTATAAIAEDASFFRKGTFDGITGDEYKASMPEYFGHGTSGGMSVAEIPDIYGPGAVLSVGNVFMKVTNLGLVGNPYTNLSSDPSGQWPGASGIEYLNAVAFAVGAVNPEATDANAIRRVSYFSEWRPPTLDAVDKMYRAYDGILNGQRFYNDDQDSDPATGEERIDEDFLDGHDNDLDGVVDEDYSAQGQQMFSCVIRDDTEQAINAAFAEKHVPLGLECQQLSWAYSVPGFTDFNVVQWTIFNRSGHVLDSVYVGALVDMDCGPATQSAYWSDDMDLVGYPSGRFRYATLPTDKRLQDSTMRILSPPTPADVDVDSALCTTYWLRVNTFSIADDNGDEGLTTGIPTMQLVSYTVDPTAKTGPDSVCFHAYRSYTGSTPYTSGGGPRTDAQRYEFMSGAVGTNIGEDGFVSQEKGEEKGDYVAWFSCGPWFELKNDASVQLTIAFSVSTGTLKLATDYKTDYTAYYADGEAVGKNGKPTALDLINKYPSLANCFAIQVAYEGIYEENPTWPALELTNGHGRETRIRPALGEENASAADCHDEVEREATHIIPNWYDFDCSYCTGAYDNKKGLGMFHRTWNADAPPPNPNLNVASSYNYSANEDRIVATGDNQVTLAWDNLSEITADPKTGKFDFRGYRVWKAANWTRPVGSAGPSDDDWALLGEFRYFYGYDNANNFIERNYAYTDEAHTDSICPKVFVPNYVYPAGSEHCPSGCVDTATVDVCLRAFDLWDRQSGQILRWVDVPCAKTALGDCDVKVGCILSKSDCSKESSKESRTRFPVGRYQLVDKEVKNGFVYFYAVTAFDSTGSGKTKLELSGRRSATESDGVIPQATSREGRNVWVVPNPYRGYANLQERPSSWDLTPNGSDPTGTHIDFLGLPRGPWTIRIFTVAGDLVQTIRSTDGANESIRGDIVTSSGGTVPGYTAQQDNLNDGQASWNLISRNGQDIVSGIYLFTVESANGTQRGKFVVIR